MSKPTLVLSNDVEQAINHLAGLVSARDLQLKEILPRVEEAIVWDACMKSPSQGHAAALLGVHRNTVVRIMGRIRK